MDEIDRIRAFNRAHTRRLGLLRQGYLEAGLSLAEARVIFELADGIGWTAGALSQHLGLNEGYLSRLLSRLSKSGLVEKTRHPQDGRAHILGLTRDGLIRAAELTALSRAQIESWVDGMPEAELAQLVARMEAVEASLARQSAPAPEVELRDLAIGDAGWLVEQHGVLYARDEGFDASFEALVAEILADFIRHRDPAYERGWIAWQDGARLGSIFCVKGPEPGLAKLRMFLLLPEARGLGLGQRLLDTCMSYARETGYRRMVLWTHESHEAACALYRKNGFSLDSAVPVTSFGVDLVEQQWSIDLAG
ncbi:bifunctional helix-turn-helix transcriptional regulator/GNAT family N-acetyltransferase [Fontisubflavum oceani]|uniref:bifunctional helix-turn-helix transcriptional regulator/GNAT family N-acetyltransferase n=1 Tax=Fontisubflavum oceani TaxID=2978973 RepID=UPI002ED01516